MPLILEDEGKKLAKRQLTLPQYLVNHLQNQYNIYGNKSYSTTKGYKRLNSLLNKGYNNPTDKKDRQHNNACTISFADAKRIDHDIRHMNQSEDNAEYAMIGGDTMRDWVHSSLGSLRNSVHQVSQVPKVPQLDKNPTKVAHVDNNLKVNGMELKVENKWFENNMRKLF